jgi:hypothetical protein
MTIERHKDSHVDHALTEAQLEWILSLPAEPDTVTVQTVELPLHLGTVPCALYGPAMGDDPIPESAVQYERRGNREGESRMLAPYIEPWSAFPTYPEPRQVRTVTVISGPHDGRPCVLFTAFGGPQAPREPWEDDSEESAAFWREHALAAL